MREILQEALNGGPTEKLFQLELTEEERFAITELVKLQVQGMRWNAPEGVDIDQLELRFRRGKLSLKAKLGV